MLIFTNLQNSQVQYQIKQFCQGKSGVYKITNLKNNKIYIGSALTKTPSGNRLCIRFRNQFFNHHKNCPVKNAIKNYGIHNFSWEILEFTLLQNTRIRESY